MTGLNTDEKNYSPTFIIMSVMFLMWGLITVLNGFLVQQLMNALVLNYTDSVIMAMTFFGAYLLVSIPAGRLIDRVGFKNGIITGLLLAAIGCLLFYVAASSLSFALSLISFFMLGAGITILQVGANPYIVLVGKRGKGAQRLTFVQAFNSLGTVIATVFADKILQVDQTLDPSALRSAFAELVQMPYIIMGGVLMILAIVFAVFRLPEVETRSVDPLVKEKVFPRKHVLEFHHVALGCLAIFAYVGAEETIFRFLLTKMSTTSTEQSAKEIDLMIKLYWAGLMVGRFAGAALLSKISPRKLIIGCSLIASMLIVLFMSVDGKGQSWNTALWILTGIGLFNSILFPCIFTMAVDGLGKFSEEASSMLMMSIVGGAVIPVFVFALIPKSVSIGFLIVLVAYLFIAFFGFRGSRYEKRTNFY